MKNRFTTISPTDYEAAAVLMQAVGEQMLERLDLVALNPKRVLEVGCKTGYCTQLLQQRYSTAEVFALEISPTMLAHAKASRSAQINWLYSSLDTLPVEDHSIDLLVGNLFLPWCTDLQKTLEEWWRVLRPEGLLMFSSLGPDTLQELRGQPLHLPSFLDMHELGDAIVHAGFADPVLDVEHITFTYREQQRLQAELIATGFIADQELESLQKNADSVFPLTYEVIYGHAWQPTAIRNKVSDEGIVKIPLSHLRRHLR